MDTIKEIVQNINQAFRDNDMQAFVNYCADDVTWNMIGNEIVTGKQGILDFMKGMPVNCEPVLNEERIMVSENGAVCTGTMEMPSPDGSLFKGGFCDVYQFENGKVKTIDTYIVEFKK
jgi:ketosteroid isomerase-like protein